ncbi:Cytochrome P450 [Pyrenophora tritici-repentis]|nr:Cytochrome P450 [Pyrenophora tritici-repentis]
MSNSQLYTGALVLLVIYLVISPIIRALMTPLRSVPGPFLARFTRLWELRAVRKHDFATYNIALHEEYGPVVRLAPNRYSVNDTGASRVLLGYHNALDKSNYYTPFGDPSQGNLFSEVNVQIHANIRRPISQLYSNNNLLSYEPFVNACNSILLRRLKEYSGSGKQLNVRHLMQYYAFDVIGEITLGSRFGFMEEDGDKAGLITAIDEGLDYGAKVGLIPEVHWALCKAAEYLGIKSPFMKVMDFILLQIQNRVSGQTISPKDRQDFLDKLLPLEKWQSYSTRHNKRLRKQYWSRLRYDGHLLREELDDAVNRGAASDPITFKESQKLPYLRAVIQETLRMHPAVGAPLTRIIGIGGANLAGRYFPAGTEVGVNPWVIHNNKEIFGPDASKFRPERWLVQDAEKRAVMDRNFLTFGAGSRTCIGKNISLLEMYKVIPQIVKV